MSTLGHRLVFGPAATWSVANLVDRLKFVCMSQQRLYEETRELRFHSKCFSVIYARDDLYVKTIYCAISEVCMEKNSFNVVYAAKNFLDTMI